MQRRKSTERTMPRDTDWSTERKSDKTTGKTGADTNRHTDRHTENERGSVTHKKLEHTEDREKDSGGASTGAKGRADNGSTTTQRSSKEIKSCSGSEEKKSGQEVGPKTAHALSTNDTSASSSLLSTPSLALDGEKEKEKEKEKQREKEKEKEKAKEKEKEAEQEGMTVTLKQLRRVSRSVLCVWCVACMVLCVFVGSSQIIPSPCECFLLIFARLSVLITDLVPTLWNLCLFWHLLVRPWVCPSVSPHLPAPHHTILYCHTSISDHACMHIQYTIHIFVHHSAPLSPISIPIMYSSFHNGVDILIYCYPFLNVPSSSTTRSFRFLYDLQSPFQPIS